jgi:hypothetical protein
MTEYLNCHLADTPDTLRHLVESEKKCSECIHEHEPQSWYCGKCRSPYGCPNYHKVTVVVQ